jgi:hypothetical protein
MKQPTRNPIDVIMIQNRNKKKKIRKYTIDYKLIISYKLTTI